MIYAGRTCLPYIRVPIMYRCPYVDTYIDAMETLSPLFTRMARRLSG